MQNETRPDSGTGNVKGFYVHAPFCDGKCFYCAFYSLPYESELAKRYIRALAVELKEYPPLNVETIYFGGGTPSLLSLSELEILCNLIKKTISVVSLSLKEWTVECNPRSLDAEKLALMAKAGVNRISLGAQSFDDSVLKWLGRRHNVADIYEAAQMIKSAGFDNFSLDLIACIPGFKADVWRRTLDAAVALEPKHVSVYALTKEERTSLAKSVAQGQVMLLTEDEEIEALKTAADILADADYQRYEISNYSKSGYECLHNLSCWRGEEYIGLGPAAASLVGLKRWTNLPDLEKYLAVLEGGEKPPRAMDVLDEKLRQIEKVVFGLRMSEGISEATGKICEKTLRDLNNEGLVLNADGCWRLTERGFWLADYVGAELLAEAS
ncbi:MAG: radical SAM family heme chaperone HemW [Kiritimatiellia bacterium]|nr:radical SAM family heme chaperone HemW [Kiritimatiellia bacterium]